MNTESARTLDTDSGRYSSSPERKIPATDCRCVNSSSARKTVDTDSRFISLSSGDESNDTETYRKRHRKFGSRCWHKTIKSSSESENSDVDSHVFSPIASSTESLRPEYCELSVKNVEKSTQTNKAYNTAQKSERISKHHNFSVAILSAKKTCTRTKSSHKKKDRPANLSTTNSATKRRLFQAQIDSVTDDLARFMLEDLKPIVYTDESQDEIEQPVAKISKSSTFTPSVVLNTKCRPQSDIQQQFTSTSLITENNRERFFSSGYFGHTFEKCNRSSEGENEADGKQISSRKRIRKRAKSGIDVPYVHKDSSSSSENNKPKRTSKNSSNKFES